LSSDRREVQAPIPYSSIVAYADRHGIADEDFDRFKTLIRACDGEYLERTARQISQPQSARR